MCRISAWESMTCLPTRLAANKKPKCMVSTSRAPSQSSKLAKTRLTRPILTVWTPAVHTKKKKWRVSQAIILLTVIAAAASLTKICICNSTVQTMSKRPKRTVKWRARQPPKASQKPVWSQWSRNSIRLNSVKQSNNRRNQRRKWKH